METKKYILDDIRLRSEQVNEVLENPPHWMIRWGSLLILLIIAVFFLLASIIKYPDFIESPIIISSENPPERMEVTIDSRIEKILFQDHQPVRKGDLVLILESTANYQDVLALECLVDEFSTTEQLNRFPLKETAKFRLGEIQEDFNAFAKAVQDESLFNNLQPYAVEGMMADKNIKDYESRIVNLKQQCELEKTKVQLTEKNYNRCELLQQRGVISPQELENEKLKLLEVQRSLKNTQITLAQLDEAIVNFRKTKTGAAINTVKDQATFSTAAVQLFEKLRKSIRQWKRTYLLYSATDGTLSFLKFLGEKQFVKNGTNLFSILPDSRQVIIGQMLIGPQNQGKLKPEQKVLIKLDNFKYQEYGVVKGLVKSISLTPDKENKYYVEVTLPNGLKSSYNKNIAFDKELSGNASIVTEELTIAQRIFNQLRTILKYQES
ncbi:MAG: HlyD family efflux transporter periplasmic adaptor subunit [Sphingobacterium sp.]|nr:HlyD family efflux transporter periplasmic adaptor subunit [Sphingobacterium sp.]